MSTPTTPLDLDVIERRLITEFDAVCGHREVATRNLARELVAEVRRLRGDLDQALNRLVLQQAMRKTAETHNIDALRLAGDRLAEALRMTQPDWRAYADLAAQQNCNPHLLGGSQNPQRDAAIAALAAWKDATK